MGRVSLRFEGDSTGARRAIREIGREIEGTAESANSAFSADSLADYVIGLGSVATAVQGLTALYREFNEVSEQALGRLEGSRESTAALVQLAGSPEEFKALQGAADQFSGIAGVDRAQADRALFAINSAGFGAGDVSTFARAQTIGFEAGDTARSLATLRGTLGAEELGGLEGQLSKLIAASAASPSLPGAIAEGAARSGALASRLGISDEELLSAEAILATSTGSAERGATQLQALLKSAASEEDRFKGLGLGGILQEISSGGIGGEGTTGPELQKGFGRAEGFLGFASLQANLPQFQRVLSNVQAANSGQDFRDKLAFIGADQTAAAVGELQSSEQALAQAEQGFGVDLAQRRAALNRRNIQRLENRNVLGRLGAGALPEGVGEFGGDVALETVAEAASQGVTATLLGKIAGLLEDVVRNTGETSKKAGGVVGQAVPGADE